MGHSEEENKQGRRFIAEKQTINVVHRVRSALEDVLFDRPEPHEVRIRADKFDELVRQLGNSALGRPIKIVRTRHDSARRLVDAVFYSFYSGSAPQSHAPRVLRADDIYVHVQAPMDEAAEERVRNEASEDATATAFLTAAVQAFEAATEQMRSAATTANEIAEILGTQERRNGLG